MKKKVIDVQKAKLYQIGGGSNFDSDSDSEKKFPANPTPTPTPKISGLLTPAPTPTPTESESKSGFGVPRWSLLPSPQQKYLKYVLCKERIRKNVIYFRRFCWELGSTSL